MKTDRVSPYGGRVHRRIDKHGYCVLRWKVPGTKRYESIKEHRAVWQEHNGPIPPGHVVHHDNEVKTDNRIENLVLMTITEHNRLHAAGNSHVPRKWNDGPLDKKEYKRLKNRRYYAANKDRWRNGYDRKTSA